MNKEDYDKEQDIWFKHFGKNNTIHSRELKNVNILVDFDKNDDIVGVEIYDFMKAIRESDKEIEKIFKLKDK